MGFLVLIFFSSFHLDPGREATEGELTLRTGCLLDLHLPPLQGLSGSAGQAAIPSLARRGQQTLDCAAWEGVCPRSPGPVEGRGRRALEKSPASEARVG